MSHITPDYFTPSQRSHLDTGGGACKSNDIKGREESYTTTETSIVQESHCYVETISGNVLRAVRSTGFPRPGQGVWGAESRDIA